MGPLLPTHSKHGAFSEPLLVLVLLLPVLFPLISMWLPLSHGSGLSLNITFCPPRPHLECSSLINSHKAAIIHPISLLNVV